MAKSKLSRYKKHVERSREIQQEISLVGRDIFEAWPEPDADGLAARDECRLNFKRFCELFFPETFYLPWSDDHLKVVSRIEEAVLGGGQFGFAMPRGSGKSSLCEAACLWATLYAHRDYVLLIGATELHAKRMLESIATELETNEKLLTAFPEIIYPIRRLDGIALRCNGQIFQGKPTRQTYTTNEIVFATIEGSPASGACIQVAGITGNIRGRKRKKADGKTSRPSLVFLDDPQTDESAKSLEQSQSREDVITKAILGLAGPGKKISVLATCTVINKGDLSDRILDRKLFPEWHGERLKLMNTPPKDMTLWDQYNEIRKSALLTDGNFVKATEFYKTNQAAMDAGASVSWAARFNPDEISAIQYAMDLRFINFAAFQSEYQNDPITSAKLETGGGLDATELSKRRTGSPVRLVPASAQRITAYIDVQKNLLFYAVTAWNESFGGSVIWYGSNPEQGAPYFSAASTTNNLETKYKAGQSAAIFQGIQELLDVLFGAVFKNEDGFEMRLDKAAIDANWGPETQTVYEACRKSSHAGQVYPAHGKYVGAGGSAMETWAIRPGEIRGTNWRVSARSKLGMRSLLYDTNYWKSFVAQRLKIPVGDQTALWFYGNRETDHRLFLDHLCAEFPVLVEAKGRAVDEWKSAPHVENHWWDCVVGTAVVASTLGLAYLQSPQKLDRPKRLKLSELQRGKA